MQVTYRLIIKYFVAITKYHINTKKTRIMEALRLEFNGGNLFKPEPAGPKILFFEANQFPEYQKTGQ